MAVRSRGNGVERVDPGSDEDLVARYREGDEAALLTLLARYRSFARMKSHAYFLIGADRDDIIQEGMIGLYKAIRDYDPSRETSFRGFAEVCITRQIITAVKTATRQKHGPLNSYVSLNGSVVPDGGDGDRSLADIVPTASVADPLELIVSSETVASIKVCFAEILSGFETEVLHLYVEGKSYQEIGDRLGRTAKAIDNALQRVRRKVEIRLRDRGEIPEVA